MRNQSKHSFDEKNKNNCNEKGHCKKEGRNEAETIGALIIMISAVVLITGCPQPNNKKDNTTVNNNGNNNLNGSAWFESGYHIGYYFLDGKVYAVDSNKWENLLPVLIQVITIHHMMVR